MGCTIIRLCCVNILEGSLNSAAETVSIVLNNRYPGIESFSLSLTHIQVMASTVVYMTADVS